MAFTLFFTVSGCLVTAGWWSRNELAKFDNKLGEVHKELVEIKINAVNTKEQLGELKMIAQRQLEFNLRQAENSGKLDALVAELKSHIESTRRQ